MGPNSVPIAADDGPKDDVDRAGNVEHLLGKQVVVIERVNDAGKRCHCGGDDHRNHLVMKRVDAGRARGFFILADRQPEISDAAFQQRATKNKGQHGRRQQHVIEHHRMAAQLPEIVMGVLRNRQKQAGRGIGPAEVIEPDPREFGKRDGENGEVDAGNPKAEGQEADKGTGERRDRNRHKQADPGTECQNGRRAPPRV